ncbi:MAG: J domain-containing protein [Cyanobium sp.]
MPTHYEALGVSPDASSQQLRQAFRALSKLYHPDTTSLPAAEAEVAFQRVRQAYGVLGDAAARRAYDERLRQPLRPAVVFRPPASPAGAAFQPRPASVRRSLSGGEWFALVLLAVALALSLVLGVGLAWARGAELMTRPSWWIEPPVVPVLSSSEPVLSSGEPVLSSSKPGPALRQAP